VSIKTSQYWYLGSNKATENLRRVLVGVKLALHHSLLKARRNVVIPGKITIHDHAEVFDFR
jgi:hypothetical protein